MCFPQHCKKLRKQQMKLREITRKFIWLELIDFLSLYLNTNEYDKKEIVFSQKFSYL